MSKLLIVEDEVKALVALRKGLTRRGYKIAAAANATDAIEVSETFCPDLLLCDWVLKGVQTGLDVAEALRQANPELAIIFMTGLPVAPLKAVTHHLQPCAFLEKPLRFHVIEAAITQALSPRTGQMVNRNES